MKNLIIICIGLLIVVYGCTSENQNTRKKNNREIYFKERLVFAKQMRKINLGNVVDLSKNENEYSKIHQSLIEMQDQIENAIFHGKNDVSFGKLFTFFKNQKRIDCSFWKTNKVDIEISLYILERLTYELGQSEWCNDYYVFDKVQVTCDTLGKNEFILKWEANSSNYREDVIIRSKENDSILRYENFEVDEKVKKIKLNENEKIDGVIFRKKYNTEVVKW